MGLTTAMAATSSRRAGTARSKKSGRMRGSSGATNMTLTPNLSSDQLPHEHERFCRREADRHSMALRIDADPLVGPGMGIRVDLAHVRVLVNAQRLDLE